MGTLVLLGQDFLLELRFCLPNIQCLLFSVNSQEQEKQRNRRNRETGVSDEDRGVPVFVQVERQWSDFQ